jgi:hypothetical protein
MPAVRPFVAALSVVASALVGCASADGENDLQATTSAAVTSHTRVLLVPVDARARTACREEVGMYYCDEATARAATARCKAKIGATQSSDPCAKNATGEGCIRRESYDEQCNGAAPVYPDRTACATPRPKSCSFYAACVETNISCGEDGYALGYGEKYCNAFKNIEGLSARGTTWRDGVMLCLQQELVGFTRKDARATCDDVLETAFDSHPRCYTKPERSICFLPPGDVLAIVNTIGGRELLTARSRKQILSTVGTCLFQIGRVLNPFRISSKQASPQASFAVDASLDLEAQRAFFEQLERDYAE